MIGISGSHGEQNLVLKIRAHVKKAVIRESISLVDPRDKTRLIPLIGSFHRDAWENLPEEANILCVLCAVYIGDDDIYSNHCMGNIPAGNGRIKCLHSRWVFSH
jgi:hypothetical protein